MSSPWVETEPTWLRVPGIPDPPVIVVDPATVAWETEPTDVARYTVGVPERRWVFVDQAGHAHATTDDRDNPLPTLMKQREHQPCDGSCHGLCEGAGYSATVYRCRDCGEVVEPDMYPVERLRVLARRFAIRLSVFCPRSALPALGVAPGEAWTVIEGAEIAQWSGDPKVEHRMPLPPLQVDTIDEGNAWRSWAGHLLVVSSGARLPRDPVLVSLGGESLMPAH